MLGNKLEQAPEEKANHILVIEIEVELRSGYGDSALTEDSFDILSEILLFSGFD